jgi:hypothetical protein
MEVGDFPNFHHLFVILIADCGIYCGIMTEMMSRFNQSATVNSLSL